MERIPSLPRFVAVAVIFSLATFSMLRLGFWLYFDPANNPVPLGELLAAFYLGLKFDLRFALALLLPLLLLGEVSGLNPFRRRPAKTFWVVYLTVAGAATLLFYMVDFGHYAYFGTRVDATALEGLRDWTATAQMVWESYPVVGGSLVAAAAAALVAYLAHRLFLYCGRGEPPPLGWRGRAAVRTATILLVLAGLYGKLSYYPLRWSDAFFSERTFVSQLALHPVLYFTDTVRYGGGATYDEDQVGVHYAEMAEWLGVARTDKAGFDFRRTGDPVHKPAKPPNVVIVLLESMATHKTGLSGNPLRPTPHIDALARNGYYFSNFFVPLPNSARSIFCALTGIPDVETHGTSSRNPRAVEQHSIVNCFLSYEKFYFLGGSVSWGNIRGLLTHNISGLHILEEGSYSAPRIDVWGISDLDLFRAADQVLREQTGPFLAVIQTSGNHPPYTIPDDNAGFEFKDMDAEELRRWGFSSVEHFNSCRFMDHSVGQFMQMARESDYFDDTIFVFFADHGIAGFPGEHVSEADTRFQLGLFRVPLIIYSPGMIPEGRVIETVASEPDVLPTLASLAGQRYINTTLGRDLLDPRFHSERYAFIMRPNPPVQVGLISDRFYFEMSAEGDRPRLKSFKEAAGGDNLVDRYPGIAAEMERFARAYLETARYMLFHNKPDRDRRDRLVRPRNSPRPQPPLVAAPEPVRGEEPL